MMEHKKYCEENNYKNCDCFNGPHPGIRFPTVSKAKELKHRQPDVAPGGEREDA
jgi:hypothetical protein